MIALLSSRYIGLPKPTTERLQKSVYFLGNFIRNDKWENITLNVDVSIYRRVDARPE
jgi:hypothetical protein